MAQICSENRWNCTSCTLFNSPSSQKCSVCGTDRSVTKNEWPCDQCTFLNPSTATSCAICGAARNLHGDALSNHILVTHNKTNTDAVNRSVLGDESKTMDHDIDVDDVQSAQIVDIDETQNDVDPVHGDDGDFEMEQDDGDGDEWADSDGDGDDDDGDWGDDSELVYDGQMQIRIDDPEEEDWKDTLDRALEKRRRAKAKLEAFWKCGKCQFLLSRFDTKSPVLCFQQATSSKMQKFFENA